ncbi:hypothetical protein K437DRAFT_74264 [Tilletiaria anomala UBC 951]|uniref:Uncharacterized protein n=1 Tax=Tilletiaria anomala (strain ATCC 24038 / CBS 436.72 / UBC 951) TaxID=1037660 RepID=A0A066WBN0_TILAU|nr:uncharacterized protein K437DRAFT_74264 [Tilletiaria anomala UBC 951]KDN49938.1 hypothetical protein K437DRAFT_74264 [Tilletiaria anomala UBC 951]
MLARPAKRLDSGALHAAGSQGRRACSCACRPRIAIVATHRLQTFTCDTRNDGSSGDATPLRKDGTSATPHMERDVARKLVSTRVHSAAAFVSCRLSCGGLDILSPVKHDAGAGVDDGEAERAAASWSDRAKFRARSATIETGARSSHTAAGHTEANAHVSSFTIYHERPRGARASPVLLCGIS